MGITEVRFAAQPVHVAAPKSHASALLAPLFGNSDGLAAQCSRTTKHADSLLKTPTTAQGSRLSLKA